MAKKIIIVGAGIIGASLAYHLAKAGAEVLIVEELQTIGGVATPNSWAWINASWGNSGAYVMLRMRAMQEWRNLGAVHPGLAVNWCGGLLWDLPADQLAGFVAERENIGYSVKLVDQSQALQIEPRLKYAPEIAAHAAGEGAIEPLVAVRGFLVAAQALGAKIITQSKVAALAYKEGKVIGLRTDDATHFADEIVLAAGARTANLLASIGVELKMDAPAGLLVHSKPCAKLLHGLAMAPELHVRQTGEGRLVAGSDFGGSQPGDDVAATARELFSKVGHFLRGAEDLEMDFFSLGFRPTPADGMPAIGRPTGVDGLYVAVMHSGITLAPAVGVFGAAEILRDQRDPLLIPFHPDRLCS
jgi:glycine/D-amino acid oxidase-like deaminating enzyme